MHRNSTKSVMRGDRFEFVVGLVILENLAGLLLPVSRKLQAVENDLTQATKDVTVALSALENICDQKQASRRYLQRLVF